jgi:ABC-type phosphate transport system auxiliary subunit
MTGSISPKNLIKKILILNFNHKPKNKHMKKTDFQSEIKMRMLCQSLYNGLRLARKLMIDLDIDRRSKTNYVLYKGALQALNTLIDQLKFED